MLKDITSIEQALHNELGRRKKEVILHTTHVSKVVNENEDIRNIRNKIDAAYISKQHLDQMNKNREQEAVLQVDL